MHVNEEENKSKGRFFIQKEGQEVAELSYSKAGPEKIIIDHTQVNDEYRGEGLGKSLVHHAVDFARKKDLKIIPLCPYARSVISADPDLQDVL